jgi:hypothetical protein
MLRTSKPLQRATASTLPFLLALGFAIVATWMVTRTYHQQQLATHYFVSEAAKELQPFRERYGPRHYSQNVEEWLIRDFLQDARGGVFLDVGASHHEFRSNTYYLETHLGWSGVAIDALNEYAAGYLEHRPRTKYVAIFASDEVDASVRLFVPQNREHMSSTSERFAAGFGDTIDTRTVPTTTLTHVLDQAGLSAIDFMSMDVELSEPAALRGLDIRRFRPQLVCIEGHAEVRQAILDYFHRHGYVLVGKYLRADPMNLYFTPAKTE